MERVKTGIPGLDELLDGGLPVTSTTLVTGGAGTCKTILGLQYLYTGAKDYKEPGVYVTIETSVKNITWNIESFGWDMKQLQDKNMLRIYRLQFDMQRDVEAQIGTQLSVIASIVREMKAKRLVIDSTTSFGIWVKDQGELRSLLFKFSDGLKELGCTTMLIAETKGGRTDFSAFGVEEFIVDGVIALYFTPPNRSIFVRKMRGTNHDKKVHPIEIVKNGLAVKPKDEVMWDAIK
jgi:KaiC/GvpD/RAD55 family RecA-like ATPase